jgi:hypothetical protein
VLQALLERALSSHDTRTGLRSVLINKLLLRRSHPPEAPRLIVDCLAAVEPQELPQLAEILAQVCEKGWRWRVCSGCVGAEGGKACGGDAGG